MARLRDKKPDLHSGALEVIGDRLRQFWPAGRITGFAPDRSTFVGQDEGDLHVHSAAVAGGVDIVVTDDPFGLLPPDGRGVDDLPYEVMTADEFLCLVVEQGPGAVCAVALKQARHGVRRHGDVNLVAHLKAAGCPRFAEHVRRICLSLDTASFLPD